jgi:HSP20 family molecular chaperone IbpA
VQTYEGFEVKLDIPGVAKERIQVDMEDGVLSVSVEPEEQAAPSKGDEGSKNLKWHCAERSREFKKRSFKLPETADASNVTAVYENGVLSLTVPKRELPNTRKRIEIS